MSDSNEEETKPEKNITEDISEKELYELFEFNYDDLFCKILKISQKSLIYFLKQQVIYNLQIIKKKVSPETLNTYLDLFIKRYKDNYKLVKKNFNIIKEKESKEKNDLIYLDITKCYIHCPKCVNIVHKCRKKLVLYDEYIYCITCNNVYNKNQIMLYCSECNKNYLTKLRKPVFDGNKKFEKLFLLKFKKYHCNTDKDEKIKCIKCSNNLYFRLVQNNPIKDNKIKIIYCIKCKLKYNLEDVFFKCKICLKNFQSEAKLFRDFSNNQKKLLFLIHTLLRNKSALPLLKQCEIKCKCDLKYIKEYYHKEDQGKLLEGIKNGKTSVVCEKCFINLKFEEVNWTCPECGEVFKYKKNNQSNNLSMELGEENDVSQSRKIPVFKVNLSKINDEKIPKDNTNKYKRFKYENQIDNFNIKIIMNKKIENINTINLDYNKNNIKKAFINQGDKIKKSLKSKFALKKSRSKNDIVINKNKYNNSKNNNINDKQKNKNIIKSKSKSKNKNLIDNDSINKNNNEVKNIVNNEKESKIIKNEEDKQKENDKNIDTKNIFNKIIDNIYNLEEEPYSFMSPRKENENKPQKNIIIEKNENNQIKPKHKNSQYLDYNKDLNINNIYKEDKSFILNEDNYENELQEQKINDIQIKSTKKILSSGNIDNNLKENNEHKHIRYTKKIYLFNGKNQQNNGYQPIKLLRKSIKNSYFNRNQNQNFYGNDNEYIYSNDSSFQNFDNYYMNYPNYKEYPSFNLYNFNSENYSIVKLLGKGANGKIYLVLDTQTNQNYALKSLLIDNELQIKLQEEEYNLIYNLIYENPELKIVNIYGLEVRRVDKFNIFFNILMEPAISDWEVEIISRKKNKKYYTEEELIYILANLVNTLAILQEKNISHRDLKPQNILYFGNNEYKICDFDEATYAKDKKDKRKTKNNNLNLDESKQTIRGTELYMSPILFKAVKYRPDSLTKYNSFKSDIFSLGLCFLYASTLDTNILFRIREIFDMNKIMKIVNEYLGTRYSQNYINILLYMLQIDENYRPDFIELNSWLLFGNS